jgi:acetamidase/formamidase
MSIAADFTVTQVVDGRQGVHVRIPRTIFPSASERAIAPTVTAKEASS